MTLPFISSSAGLPLAFTDDMEQLVVCDTTVEEFLAKHPSVNSDAKPRVVTIQENPFIASLLSENATSKIRCLETEIQEDIGQRGVAKLHIADELLKAALVLSHASSVAVHFGFPCNTHEEFPDETDGPLGAVALVKALKALGKEVTFIVSYYHVKLVQELVRKFLGNEVPIVEFTPERTQGSGSVRTAANQLLFHDAAHQMRPKFDTLVAIEAVGRTEEGRYMTMKARDLSDVCKVSPVDEVFIQGTCTFYGKCSDFLDGVLDSGSGGPGIEPSTLTVSRTIRDNVLKWWKTSLPFLLIYTDKNGVIFGRVMKIIKSGYLINQITPITQ